MPMAASVVFEFLTVLKRRALPMLSKKRVGHAETTELLWSLSGIHTSIFFQLQPSASIFYGL